jgi:hypothetical protein
MVDLIIFVDLIYSIIMSVIGIFKFVDFYISVYADIFGRSNSKSSEGFTIIMSNTEKSRRIISWFFKWNDWTNNKTLMHLLKKCGENNYPFFIFQGDNRDEYFMVRHIKDKPNSILLLHNISYHGIPYHYIDDLDKYREIHLTRYSLEFLSEIDNN